MYVFTSMHFILYVMGLDFPFDSSSSVGCVLSIVGTRGGDVRVMWLVKSPHLLIENYKEELPELLKHL